MKRFFLTILTFVIVSSNSLAQNSIVAPPVKMNSRVMNVYKQKRQIALTNKKPSTSSDNASGTKIQGINVSQVVDLGLSVKWAGWNLGATSPEQYGGLYGWGDAKGMNKSRDLSQYPTATPPMSISGSQYDTARNLWGKNWRMPSAYEMMELYNECTWQWMTFRGVAGVKITGPNGNAIFIPAAGSRDGFEKDCQGEELTFWSGVSDPSDEDAAFVISVGQSEFNNEIDREFYADERYCGLSIRPVFDSDLPLYELSSRDLESFSTWGEDSDIGNKTQITRADLRRAIELNVESVSVCENGQWGPRQSYDLTIYVIWDKYVVWADGNSYEKIPILTTENNKDNQGNTQFTFRCKSENINGGDVVFTLNSSKSIIFMFVPEENTIMAFSFRNHN